ncbi:MAG: hypothetical protein AVO33_10965 [delta proteobacterium ML8_F1]|nr:MAG: hypothetical protein AVO33_10965 [delta proteobacterium ML8_F1]
MDKIQLVNITKSYQELPVLEDFTLSLPHKEITCIVGPSGCGKTTLLNILAGLEVQDKGQVRNLDKDLISYVFQEPRLLPWKTAEDNLKFVLRDKVAPLKLDHYVKEWLDKVELLPFKDYYPRQMSGGMMQRLALARAFALPSDVLLMDEPFKGLDAPLRHKMLELTRKLWGEENKTIIFVTHDIQESLLIGHRVIALSTRPARILDDIKVDIAVRDRKIGCVKLARVEGYLYDLIEHGSLGLSNCPRITQIKERYYDSHQCKA